MAETQEKSHFRNDTSVNTLGTKDQQDVTRRALRMLDTPEVKAGRAKAAMLWKAVLYNDLPQEAWDSFDDMMEDFVFNYVMKAANSDPNYPKVLHVYTPPHEWEGVRVPGSRWGGDNCDNVYRIIPVDAKARYRLDGQQIGDGPPNVSYTLVGNWETSKTLAGIENHELEIAADGSFSITIDPEPANGRANHIQSRPSVLLLFIRDSLTDWTQPANALTIHRLDPPDAPPISDQAVAELAADIMCDGVALVYWFQRFMLAREVNKVDFVHSGSVGGLVTQRSAPGHVILKDDEVLVLTIDDGGAAYSAVQSHNYWFTSGRDYAGRTISLNKAQTVANADGTISYVLAVRDPGVHNWVDTGGVHDFPLMVRVQGIDPQGGREPTIRAQHGKIDDLKSMLPPETKWMTSGKRKAQIDQRIVEHALRLTDH